MAKEIGYKSAPANEKKGYKTHGSFKNDGQKKGKQGANKKKPASETLAKQKLDIQLKQISKGMLSKMDHVKNRGQF